MAQSKRPQKQKSNSAFAFVLAILIVGIIAAITGFAFFSPAARENSAAKEAANTALEESFNPSAEKRAQTVKSFDEAFKASAGVSFSELGISSEDFASWLYDGASYNITGVNVNTMNDTQTADVNVKVTTHSLTDMEANITALSSSLEPNAFAQASNESEVYKIIGDVVQQAMAETPLTTKELTLLVVQKDGTWQVDKTEAANFVIQAFTTS